MLNHDDYITVKIIKVRDVFGNFAHWEYQINFDNDKSSPSGGSGSTFHEVFDDSYDAILNAVLPWIADDSRLGKYEQ